MTRFPRWKLLLTACTLGSLACVVFLIAASQGVASGRGGTLLFFQALLLAWLPFGLWPQKSFAWWLGVIASTPPTLIAISRFIAGRVSPSPLPSLASPAFTAWVVLGVMTLILLVVHRDEFDA